jgi:hypothetical protein
MTPLEGSSVSPGGKAPAETVQAYGVVPPTAVSALEYATPNCPSGIQLVDSCKIAGVALWAGDVASVPRIRAHIATHRWRVLRCSMLLFFS